MTGKLGLRVHAREEMVEGVRATMRDIGNDCTYDYRYPLCVRL